MRESRKEKRNKDREKETLSRKREQEYRAINQKSYREREKRSK